MSNYSVYMLINKQKTIVKVGMTSRLVERRMQDGSIAKGPAGKMHKLAEMNGLTGREAKDIEDALKRDLGSSRIPEFGEEYFEVTREAMQWANIMNNQPDAITDINRSTAFQIRYLCPTRLAMVETYAKLSGGPAQRRLFDEDGPGTFVKAILNKAMEYRYGRS